MLLGEQSYHQFGKYVDNPDWNESKEQFRQSHQEYSAYLDKQEESYSYTEKHQTIPIELPPGQMMQMLSYFRVYLGAGVDVRNFVLQKNLYTTRSNDGPQEFYRNALHLANILNSEVDCLPEIVRIFSARYTFYSIELDTAATQDGRKYLLIYTDKTLIPNLDRELFEYLVYSKTEQEFWLFPAPKNGKSILLNPILLPRGSPTEHKLNFALKFEKVIKDTVVSEQFAEEPLFE